MESGLIFWAIIAAALAFQLRRVWGTATGFKGNGSTPQNEKRPYTNVSLSTNLGKFEQQLKEWNASVDVATLTRRCETLFNDLLEAFAASHYKTLKKHMSKAVYESFAHQMEKREQKGLTLHLDVRQLQTTLQNLQQTSQGIEVVVSFASEQMSRTTNAQGESFDNPAQIFVPKKDIWTFLLKGEHLTVVETTSH